MMMTHERIQPGDERGSDRRGLSLLEIVIAFAVVGVLMSLAWPLAMSAREAARRSGCQDNLRRLGVALHAYHDSQRVLPPAAIWSTAELRSLALHQGRRIDLYTRGNWIQMVLPYLGEMTIADELDPWQPISAPQFERGRNTRLEALSCPSDSYNVSRNPYCFEPTDRTSLTFARGNYAINGGSHCFKDGPGSTAFVHGDAAHLVIDEASRGFRFWGNGVAGFNQSFSLDDFANGASTLVALEELRAGVHAIDPRGVWSLGQIGGSVTWAHGVNGDAYGPNNQKPRSDDLLGCGALHAMLGAEALEAARMPCVHYIDQNFQATARSMHPGGLNVLLLDGSARFISDAVNPAVWHVIHSRDTPREILAGGLEAAVADFAVVPDQPAPAVMPPPPNLPPLSSIVNSIGMEFVLIPAGEYVMGLPDNGNGHDIPEEAPPHSVRLTRRFLIGRHEVTRKQYAQVMGRSAASNSMEDAADEPGLERFPATQVTWQDADTFCQLLSNLPAEKAVGHRYRLPTEAEWEYACRAGRESPFDWSASRGAGDVSGNAAGILPPLPLHDAGSFPPNEFGLYDMRGNAWEWCADWFDRSYYRRSPRNDPRGPQRGFIKVVRGSDWTFVGEGCKISYAMMPPWKSSPFVGFRVVCEFEDPRADSTSQTGSL